MSQMVVSTSSKYVASQPDGTASADTLLAAAGAVTKPYPINTANEIRVTVYSDAGSTCTAKIETAPTVTGPWFDVTASAPITDPSATGEQWDVPRANFCRVILSAHAAGNVRATINAWNGQSQIY